MAGVMDARGMHGVRSETEYRAKQERALRKIIARGFGQVLTVEEVGKGVFARIDANRWLVDCDCGGAAAATLGWPESLCFGCGRRYSNVIFPPNKSEIEAVLIAEQPFEPMREWWPGMTVEQLVEHQRKLSDSAGHDRSKRPPMPPTFEKPEGDPERPSDDKPGDGRTGDGRVDGVGR